MSRQVSRGSAGEYQARAKKQVMQTQRSRGSETGAGAHGWASCSLLDVWGPAQLLLEVHAFGG